MPPSGYEVPAPPPSGGGRARPGTVSLASGLLYLLGLINLLLVAVFAYSASQLDVEAVKRIYEEEGAPQAQVDAAGTAAAIAIYVVAVIFLVFAVLSLILGVFVGKGKQWARITSWVFTGLTALCCYGGSLAGGAFSDMVSGMGSTGGVDQAEISRRTAELTPDWVNTVSTVGYGVALVAALAVIILLLLPPSHPYFAKAEPQWTPPTYPAP